MPSSRQSARAQRLVTPHLGKLYRAVGKEVVNLYFRAEADKLALANASPRALRALVEKALAENPLPAKEIRRQRASRETYARLALLDKLVRAAPSLDGVTFADVRAPLAAIGCRVKFRSLSETIRRTSALHELVVRGARIRLKSDVVVELLAQRRTSKLLRFPAEEEA